MSEAPAIKITVAIPPGSPGVRVKLRMGDRRGAHQRPASQQETATEIIPEARRIEARPVAGLTFRQAAEAYVETHKGSWRNAKHTEQWTGTLEKWVYPVFGDRSVADIDIPAVLKVIETPVGDETFWNARHETARRTLNRIEAVLGWAKVHGYRTGDNPAAWRGHLEKAIPIKGRSTKHHPALPFADIAAFVAELRTREGVTPRALEFTIHTAARTGEVLGAHWSEIDLDNKLWTIPGDRMKAGKEHRVPLNAGAMDLLLAMPAKHDLIFCHPNGKRYSNMSMLSVLKRMGREDITVHGFRSTFRDWAAETTNYSNEVLEKALAHVVANSVEAAYRRGDLFEKRRQLMVEWAVACGVAASS